MPQAASHAPVALFVFARPEHTRRTLACLAANEGAAQTELVVYADGPRGDADLPAVQAVRDLVRQAQGFARVTLVERDRNWGLARNIVEGVTEVCARHGRVIVLEDDIATSPLFLRFMNAALRQYEHTPAVWHVSGWNYPIDPAGLGDAFFVRVMNCWGWATWQDRWRYFEKDPARLVREFDRQAIRRFDLDGSGVFWPQVLANHRGRMNTWAVFWYATIFRHGGLCLNPAVSYVENIGTDGSGTHTPSEDRFRTAQLADRLPARWPDEVRENPLAIERIRAFYRQLAVPVGRRVARKLTGVRDRLRGSVLRLLYTPRLRPAAHAHKLARLGSPYGAWTFIDTPALRGARVVSCGLGEDASFDVEFAAAYGAQVLLVDPTPKALRHYEAIRLALGQARTQPYSNDGRQPVASYELAALAEDSLRIVPKALWNQQTRLKFYAPPDPDHVSHSILNIQGGYRQDGAFIEVEATTVDRLVQEYGLDEIRLMKVDIEGAEIEVIQDMLRRGIRPQQLLVEYDELNFPSRRSRRRVQACHRALLASGYKLVHVDAPSNFLYTTL